MAGARWLLIGSSIAIASLASHTAAGHQLSVTGVLLTIILATALSNTVARPHVRFLPIAAVALGSQLVLHAVLSVTAQGHGHGHSSLIPDSTMVMAHTVAAVVIAGISLEADRLITAFQRLFTFDTFTLPALPTLHSALFAGLQSSLRTTDRTAWSSRGPPVFS
jgi:hypothetical protein